MLARDNPFRTSRLDQLPVEISDKAWRSLEDAIVMRGGRGAFIGREGSGKTTWLRAWRRHCIQQGDTIAWHRLRAESTAREVAACLGHIARQPPTCWVLLDGGERLGPLADSMLCRFLRPRGRLLMTRHSPGSLHALPFQPATWQQVRRWVETLTGEFPEDGAALPDLASVWARNPGDVRALFEAGYLGLAEGESIVISRPNPFARPPCRNC